jgi:hypothetical protein
MLIVQEDFVKGNDVQGAIPSSEETYCRTSTFGSGWGTSLAGTGMYTGRSGWEHQASTGVVYIGFRLYETMFGIQDLVLTIYTVLDLVIGILAINAEIIDVAMLQ